MTCFVGMIYARSQQDVKQHQTHSESRQTSRKGRHHLDYYEDAVKTALLQRRH